MDDRLSNRQMIGSLVFLILGPILWAADLTVIYGAQSSLCAFGALDQATVTMLVVAATALLILADGAIMYWSRVSFRLLTGVAPPQAQWPFLRSVMRTLAALSALAMAYFALASLMLSACEQLR